MLSTLTDGITRPLTTPPNTLFSPKNKAYADEIYSYFEPLIYTSKLFKKDEIPNDFMEISGLIKQDNKEVIKNKITHLLNLRAFLQRTEIQIELSKKGKDYHQKCIGIIYVIFEYIAKFYKINWNDNGELQSLEKRKLGLDDLINFFEATKNFDFQGGFEKNSLCSRIMSGELVGILGCSMGSEGAGWSSYLPIHNPHAQAATAIVASDLVMMAGFSLMLSSNSSIGYKFNLQKMLLGDIYSAICSNQEEKKKLKNLSRETRLELKKLLPESLNFEPFKFIPESTLVHHTSSDAEKLFQQFLSAHKITYLEIENQFRKFSEENHKIYAHYLRTRVIKINGVHGAILDHLFAKLSNNDRELLVDNLNLFLPKDRGGESYQK